MHDATLSNLLNRSSGNIIWFVRYHLKNGIAVTAEGHEESLRVLAHHILGGSMGSSRKRKSFFYFAVQFLSKCPMTNKFLPEIWIIKVDAPKMLTCGQL